MPFANCKFPQGTFSTVVLVHEVMGGGWGWADETITPQRCSN